MDDWAVQMAKEFKDRDNVKPIGAVLGKVLSIGDNWRVAIKDGSFIIDKTNGYVSNRIRERVCSYEYKHSGQTTVSGCLGGPETSYSAHGTGEVKMHEVWKPGDAVLVIPDETGQEFFVQDVYKR